LTIPSRNKKQVKDSNNDTISTKRAQGISDFKELKEFFGKYMIPERGEYDI